jgi:hypothetical protein
LALFTLKGDECRAGIPQAAALELGEQSDASVQHFWRDDPSL